MKCLLAQINPTIADFPGNTQKIIAAINHAKATNCTLVIAPELAICGYPPKDLVHYPSFLNQAEESLNELISHTQGIALLVGTVRKNPSKEENALFNSCAVIENTTLLGFQDKSLLPNYDVFDERRYFAPNKQFTTWKINGHNIAITICEDIWGFAGPITDFSYAVDPIKELKRHNPQLLVNISASPFYLNKFAVRETICKKISYELNCPVVLCNQVGANDSLIFDGCSLFVDKETVCRAKSFEETFFIPHASPSREPKQAEEQLFDALVLGVKDYFYKQNFQKALLGLSGGIDSAIVAVIACAALGVDNVEGFLLPSRFSSQSSVEDALTLARNLHMHTKTVSIEPPFTALLDLLHPIFTDHAFGIMEENLQARLRGIILMASSNKCGSLLLSTGNKSELAMGYSTLYGDLCGGLAVINDVTKTQIYALAAWINRDKEIIPYNTITKPPSAELRPNQKDLDSLPDYAVVDKVIYCYVEKFMDPEDIAKTQNLNLELVLMLIDKIHRAEYKRRQSPPGLRISPKAFTVGRSLPIVHKLH